MTLTYGTETVLAVHEYRAGVALVTTTTAGGGEPWRHWCALDVLVVTP